MHGNLVLVNYTVALDNLHVMKTGSGSAQPYCSVLFLACCVICIQCIIRTNRCIMAMVFFRLSSAWNGRAL